MNGAETLPHECDRFRILNGDSLLSGTWANYGTALRKVLRVNAYSESTGKGTPYRVQGRRRGTEEWIDL